MNIINWIRLMLHIGVKHYLLWNKPIFSKYEYYYKCTKDYKYIVYRCECYKTFVYEKEYQ